MLVPFHAYEASAGSGKTFSLVVRYLSLLFMGEDADTILALTFTNKAANEMQERIIETLKQLETRGELAVICEVTGMTREAILERRREVLGRFLDADAKVMTIDKFFAKILRKFSLHTGLMPDFSTFEAQHALKVMARFLNLAEVRGAHETLIGLSLLASKRLTDLFALLDELYAKSGELRNIRFTPEPFEPHELKIMETMERLRRFVHAHPGASATAKSGVEAASVDEVLQKSWLKRDSFEYRTFAKVYEPMMDDCLREIKTELARYMRAREQHFLHGLFELLEIYREAKLAVAREDGELSFDDITVLVHYLLKERVDSDFLYFRLDSRISHLLLDEFQDTSVVQFEILRPIIEEMRSGEGIRSGGSLFMVGDVKQSIYRFRGGTKELFYAVADAYGVQVDPLTTNYRSDRHIVAFVNDTFAGRIENYRPQQVHAKAGEGYVEVIEREGVLEAAKERVRELLDAGAASDDIAILTATNADGGAVEELLRTEGIEVVTETTSRLINQKTVRALIEYLKYGYFGAEIYARNFFALIGADYRPLERFRINGTDMVAEVQRVIDVYGLYNGDLNLLRFMEILGHYRDIEQFVFEYERIDAAAAKAELHGVRVLTVHKSKGLEYAHVIVLDRLGQKASDSSPIIYEYDGIALERIFLRMQNRAEFDPEYARAIEKERQLSAEDALNALYVAFTRAGETLCIIRKPKDSKFDLLDLTVQSRGRLEVTPAGRSSRSAPPKLPYEARRYGAQEEPAAAETETEGEANDHRAILFGLALHYTLEMMEAFGEEALERALQGTRNRYGAHLDPEAFESLRQRIAQLIDHEPFRELCRGRLWRERAVAYGGELRYLDLLVEKETMSVIVDYKSSLYGSEEHLRQVAFYKKAVAAITGKPVQGWLCYLLEDGPRLVEV